MVVLFMSGTAETGLEKYMWLKSRVEKNLSFFQDKELKFVN
jgi:hypothetical protein